jgi:hypothetical protein
LGRGLSILKYHTLKYTDINSDVLVRNTKQEFSAVNIYANFIKHTLFLETLKLTVKNSKKNCEFSPYPQNLFDGVHFEISELQVAIRPGRRML